ncbi:MAG: maleylpyruvate isomerase family mycothiol-dependent enzyme [Chloroflexi bacterium]|nr:maleylpyruvate isomerase family mycothiol-dependent enzyme [Chloroflexota bacterium]
MDIAREPIDALKAEAKRFSEYLGALPAEDWSKPSACESWQVRDVVAHLVGVAEFYAATVTRGLQGESSPPEGRPPAGSASGATLHDSIGDAAIAKREALGDKILSEFDASNEKLNGLLSSLSVEDGDRPCYHPGGLVPARNFVDLRLKELVLHEWDIRSGLDSEAHLWPEGLPSIMRLASNSLASGSVRFGFWPDPKFSGSVRYRFLVDSPAPDKSDIVIEGKEPHLEAAGSSTPDVTFRCDAETYVLVLSGRVRPEAAIENGRLSVEGDSELATAFGRWFRGI